ncbi:alpha/beta hydrolase [Streptomyces lavendulae]|uniref:alpha/beta hydrolase n=1 Tax=Streptomyces lavendulae TaxID=1914 RepID=UPI0024A21AEE|nr:alpha/beta hydrolase [Streptomyces lavendulae]GLX22700.1 alpha/beta hydrolase [Streptomyces lavendulae subsp. lavendulae]GLX24228.1 alpha/beta hydrolase [Streptomyces lavendulae subsp. lavendulae]
MTTLNPNPNPNPTPTVVLVHGAFSDATGWIGVIAELRSSGIPVIAPPNPLRGLTWDAAHLASVLAQLDGPAVLVGHAYGGALITVAGTAENVVALVYVAAYIPQEGETLDRLQAGFPPSPLTGHLKEWTYPLRDGDSAVEVTIEVTAFPSVFAADVPENVAAALAAAQRPLATAAFTEPASAAAWRTKPSWALVAGADRTIDPDLQRSGATRAGATTVELPNTSHAAPLSEPTQVAALIRDAVRATTATRGGTRRRR